VRLFGLRLWQALPIKLLSASCLACGVPLTLVRRPLLRYMEASEQVIGCEDFVRHTDGDGDSAAIINLGERERKHVVLSYRSGTEHRSLESHVWTL
jgi:hypothetical protein